MSHSTVLVIGPGDDSELARALEPFDENKRVEAYHDYVDPLPVTWKTTHEHNAKFRVLLENDVPRPEAWESVWGKENSDERIPWPRSTAIDEGIDGADDQAVADWYNTRYEGMDESEKYQVDEQGLYMVSTYNPKSKWDWYSLGGRWAGGLIVKGPVYRADQGEPGSFDNPIPPGGVSRARWGDIDWDRIRESRREGRKKSYAEAMKKDEAHRAFIYDMDPEETEEHYVNRGLNFSTFAILTPDGEWLERGEMGWFGVVHDEKNQEEWTRIWRETVEKYCTPDTVVSVVDIHI